eukprot:2558011-Pyramimonas_sp.AAC.1
MQHSTGWEDCSSKHWWDSHPTVTDTPGLRSMSQEMHVVPAGQPCRRSWRWGCGEGCCARTAAPRGWRGGRDPPGTPQRRWSQARARAAAASRGRTVAAKRQCRWQVRISKPHKLKKTL